MLSHAIFWLHLGKLLTQYVSVFVAQNRLVLVGNNCNTDGHMDRCEVEVGMLWQLGMSEEYINN